MPILDIGYREWDGKRTPPWMRVFVVAHTGIGLAWRSTWMKRLMVFLLLPSLVTAVFIGGFEQNIDSANTAEFVRSIRNAKPFQRMTERAGIDVDEFSSDPAKIRHFAWSYLLLTLFRYPQSLGMILLIGLISPRLISYDLRSRGYLLYLSRPLTPFEYVFGKACIIYFLMFMISCVPALLIYCVGFSLSTSPSVLLDTWDIPFRILIATIVFILPITAIALCFSAVTQESRYAGFAWFSFWVLGEVTYRILWAADQARTRFEDPERYTNWLLFSPYETLGYLEQQIFGVITHDHLHYAPLILTFIVTVVGYSVAYWRVVRALKV